jgi:hypothetical protein
LANVEQMGEGVFKSGKSAGQSQYYQTKNKLEAISHQ